jgi:hypothetical protein
MAFLLISKECSQELVAHTCNLSYSGERDQEDHSLNPAQANSLQDSILKKIHHRTRASGVAKDVDPEFKPQYFKKGKMETTHGSLVGFWLNDW